MSTMYDKVRDYLRGVDEKIILKALQDGLDGDCYYDYLQEIYFALPKDCPLRDSYELALDGVRRQLDTDVWSSANATRFQIAYAEIFAKQHALIQQLLTPIRDGLTDEDLRSVCLVQLRFIRALLYRQKLHLEAIMFWTPTRLLLNDEISSSREYSAMMVAHDKLAHDVEMIREK